MDINAEIKNAITHVDAAAVFLGDPTMQKSLNRYNVFSNIWLPLAIGLSLVLFLVLSPIVEQTFLMLLCSSAIHVVSIGLISFLWQTKLDKQVVNHHLPRTIDFHDHTRPAQTSFIVSVIKKAKQLNVDAALVSELLALSERTDIPHSWWIKVDNACDANGEVVISATDELKILQEEEIELDTSIVSMRSRYD